MSKEKIKGDKKTTSIPQNIIESISSLTPNKLIHSESCPPYPLDTFDIQEKLEENQSRKKVKEAEYKIGNYLIKKTLGQGTFGKVKLGLYLPTQEKVAIKILEKDRIIEKDDEIRVKREFDMLALFNHPNVILVAEIFESSDSYYSVMEYCEGGELFNYIVKNRRLSEEEAAFFYYQLISGLEYIHSLGIVHRDLKPENLLLTNEHLLKIIDFGLSNYFKEGQKDLLSTPCGSPCYASPEMVGGNHYNGFKIDIWSSGIILYAMLCGYLPFEDKDNDILFEKILECKLIYPKYITNIAKDLMEKILVTDPDTRITIAEIKKHPFYLKGKDLFEQEFSVYQITKDVDDKTSVIENIELNHILDNPLMIETDKEKEKIEDKENIDTNSDERLNNKINNKSDKIEEKKSNKKINEEMSEIQKIKENEMNNIGIEVIDIKKEITKDNKKEKEVENTKESEKENKAKEITVKIHKINNEEILTCNKNLDTKIKEDKFKKEEINNLSNNFEIIDVKTNENKENTNIQNLQNNQNIDSIKQNKSKDKKTNQNKINNNISKNISINTTSKKVDLFKNNRKLVTLIKDKDTNIRRRLIKNSHKMNIREKTKPRVFKSSKKANKLINYKNFKRHLIHQKNAQITPNLKKINTNKLISNKRGNNSRVFQKKYSSKGSINKQRLNYRSTAYSNNINNTLDGDDIPKKLKLHFNFQKITLSYVKSSKRASSHTKHNMKMTSFETSKTKKNKKNFGLLYEKDSSIKKNLENLSNNKKFLGNKFNLLYRKNLKEINLNLKNKRKKNYMDEENKKKMLKTEVSKEKTENNIEIKGIEKIKLPNIKIDKISNANIKIIDDTKDDEENNDKNKKKNYNTKTNIKKNNNNKIFKKGRDANSSGNSEYIIRTFDKEKHQRFMKQNLNKYNKISGTLNINYLKKFEKKNTIDDEDKNRRINIDISTHKIYTKKNTKGNNNNNKENNNSKKKLVKNENKNSITKNIDISRKDLLNINIDFNNKKEILKDHYTSEINYNLKDIENILKTEPSKKPSISYKKNLNSEKENKVILSHKKIVPINPIKISNYRKNQKIVKNQTQNIPKILNKTSNSSNFNSFIKNPFVQTESTNFNSINHSTVNANVNNNTQAQNITKKPIYKKNSHKVLNNTKKKPWVTIRNTVINFNMIDSGLLLASINRKKDEKEKKRTITIGPNNSLNRLHNNHLYRLCNKFNSSLISNINNSTIQGDISIKNKTINVNNNNNLHFHGKKIINYGEQYIKNFKKNSNINNRKTMINHDKFHMKFNSMRLEDLNGVKKKKKNINKNNKIGITYTSNKIIIPEQSHFNTINNEEMFSRENHKNFVKNDK